MAGRGGNTFLICWGVEGRRRNGEVGAERVWDGRAERDRSYFVLFLLLFSYSTTGGYEWKRFGGWVGGWRGGFILLGSRGEETEWAGRGGEGLYLFCSFGEILF